jgi:hypothetical protein
VLPISIRVTFSAQKKRARHPALASFPLPGSYFYDSTNDRVNGTSAHQLYVAALVQITAFMSISPP